MRPSESLPKMGMKRSAMPYGLSRSFASFITRNSTSFHLYSTATGNRMLGTVLISISSRKLGSGPRPCSYGCENCRRSFSGVSSQSVCGSAKERISLSISTNSRCVVSCRIRKRSQSTRYFVWLLMCPCSTSARRRVCICSDSAMTSPQRQMSVRSSLTMSSFISVAACSSFSVGLSRLRQSHFLHLAPPLRNVQPKAMISRSRLK
mmetsp:Transcript_25282/g.75216  ORF Transcript_25282/g.75216 Transcript_25282/m.75216 type:complete len:206 (-) Transcript_25282:363-980(-)